MSVIVHVPKNNHNRGVDDKVCMMPVVASSAKSSTTSQNSLRNIWKPVMSSVTS